MVARANQHTELLRKYSKLVHEARTNQQDDLIKHHISNYDETMEKCGGDRLHAPDARQVPAHSHVAGQDLLGQGQLPAGREGVCCLASVTSA